MLRFGLALAAVGGPLTVIVFAALIAAGAFAWQVIQVQDDLEGAMDQARKSADYSTVFKAALLVSMAVALLTA